MEEQQPIRVRTPRQGEVLGIVDEVLGASRFRVDCQDSKERICRVSGKFRKRIWVKTGDVVLVQPWEIQPEDRGDIVWRYTRTQAGWLQKRGFIK
jgi:translation initiation factor 1A